MNNILSRQKPFQRFCPVQTEALPEDLFCPVQTEALPEDLFCPVQTEALPEVLFCSDQSVADFIFNIFNLKLKHIL